MKFYELTAPDYLTDYEDMKNNPIRILPNFSVPAILCDVCGQWGSSSRIRKEIVLSDVAKTIINKRAIDISEWKKEISILATEISIPYEILTPSAEIGMPKGETKKYILNDFIHVLPGVIWVKSKVADEMKKKGFTGLEFVKANINFKNKEYHTIDNELLEVIVTGKAWRIGSDIAKITACNKCGRKIFPNPCSILVDEKRWDNTDFFTVDCNPNRIFVTQRVYEFLCKSDFKNYKCIETS